MDVGSSRSTAAQMVSVIVEVNTLVYRAFVFFKQQLVFFHHQKLMHLLTYTPVGFRLISKYINFKLCSQQNH